MIEIGLVQKQTTKLVMTTELRQAITILQYSNVELMDYLQEESLENPLLELSEKPLEETLLYNRINDSAFPAYYDPDDEKDHPIDYYHHKEENLQTYLLKQLSELSFSPIHTRILTFLIENLDDAGYLEISLQEAAKLLNESEENVNEAFQLFRQFEPLGVGARTLQECLLWQLEGLDERHWLAELIIKQDLESLAENKFTELAKKYDVTTVEIQEAADIIRMLDPKPGSAISNEATRYLFPDIIVEKVDGEFHVTVNDYMLPSVRLNRQYQYMLSQVGKSEAQKYIHEKYNKVLWLIRSIEQRRLTLQQLAEALVEKQYEFLEKGMAFLKPLTLKEIADHIGVHESTVSRAIRHKVIQTPKGIFELKDLFTSKVASTSGSDVSSTAVKHAIKQLIDGEDKRKPLSDQKISDLLKEREGITVSRRTVAKYREEMNIPSSSKRKRF